MGSAALLGVAALLLAPAVGSAQIGIRVGTPYGFGYSPGYYNFSPTYSAGYYSYGYFPYRWGYSAPYVGTYSTPPYTGTYSNYYYPGSAWSSFYGTYPNYTGSGYYGSYPTWSGSYPTYSYSSLPRSYFNPSTTYSYANPSDTGSYYSYGAAPSPQVSDTALVNIRLPDANAEVWVEGQQTRQRGTWREYISPPLNPDKNYVYDIRARWTENGKEVERTRTVPVQANGVATVDFTAPENKSRVDETDRGRTSPRPGTEAKPGDRRPGDKDRPPPDK
jgi:uncharacterized protein (TIGR03000 family)